MSRIFLLSSNVMVESYHVYPLGMAMVASALSSAGHSVCQFDFLAEGESHTRLRSAIQEFSPDFVGVSLRNIDNVDSFTSEESWALVSDRALVKTIREVTNATVVLGGPAFSIMPEEILGYVEADYGIVGDGGVLFNDLIERLEQGEKIPAISGERDTFSAGNIPLRPLWDETIINYYTRNNGMIGLRTKRGCPHNCTYCTYPAVEGTSYRVREPGAVIEDILRLKQDHNINRAFSGIRIFPGTALHDPCSIFPPRGGVDTEHMNQTIEKAFKRQRNRIFPPSVGQEKIKILNRLGYQGPLWHKLVSYKESRSRP